jgi:hypothetical protein
MCVNFRQSLIKLTNDKVLDKKDLAELKQKAADVKQADPDSQDAFDAEQVMNFLSTIKDTTKTGYSLIKEGSSKETIELDFICTPTYGEKEKVPGNTMREAISNISQGDSLNETKTDKSRCGAATLMNIALRSLADKNPEKSPEEIFAVFAKRAGVPASFTYENVHKAQDNLYKLVNKDGVDGLSAEYNIKYNLDDGAIFSAKPSGEIKNLADHLGLKTETLIGPNKDNVDDKKAAIDQFFDKNPKGSLIIGVHLSDKGEVQPCSSPDQQNHFVEVYKDDNGYFIKDTGGVSNGNSPGYDMKLEGEEAKNSFLYKSPGTTIGVTRP